MYSDGKGTIFEDESLYAIGRSGWDALPIPVEDWIELPDGGSLYELPDRMGIGVDVQTGELRLCEKGWAVAAFIPPAHTGFYIAAFETKSGAPTLPLFCYTAAGWQNGKFYVPATRIEQDIRQECAGFDAHKVQQGVEQLTKAYPHNRLVNHLAHNCALTYHCPAARNYFIGRWECPVPASPACNANCVGCISLQPDEETIVSTQDRLSFKPTVEEIVEFTVPHLETAPYPLVSFGQGCEGEPSLQADLLEPTIRSIRERTSSGTININSNAGATGAIRRLVDAGLDGIRVSLFSARPENYCWYHQPSGYDLAAVEHSAAYAAEHGVNVALNLLLYPGFTNHPAETEALYGFLTRTGVRQIQLRNLNLDPEWLTEKLTSGPLPGITEGLDRLKENFPGLAVGNYTQPRSG